MVAREFVGQVMRSVDNQAIRIPATERSYYDAHPEEKAAQEMYDMLRPSTDPSADFRDRMRLESSFASPAEKKAIADRMVEREKGTKLAEVAAIGAASRAHEGAQDRYGTGGGGLIYNKKTGQVVREAIPNVHEVPFGSGKASGYLDKDGRFHLLTKGEGTNKVLGEGDVLIGADGKVIAKGGKASREKTLGPTIIKGWNKEIDRIREAHAGMGGTMNAKDKAAMDAEMDEVNQRYSTILGRLRSSGNAPSLQRYMKEARAQNPNMDISDRELAKRWHDRFGEEE
jgi:hypothetical protein